MSSKDFSRQYIMLRPIACQAAGFARLEIQHGQGRITVHANHLPAVPSLRALLVSAHRLPGCVWDLGQLTILSDQSAALQRHALPSAAIKGYDALWITTDWPEPAPVLVGFLSRNPRCTPEQLTEVVKQYMALPCPDAAPSPAKPLPLPHQQTPQASMLLQQLEQKNRSLLPEDSLLRLSPLHWPDKITGLRTYFESLPPCAPFDAPGWRFVRIPLQEDSSFPYGVLGIHMRRHHIDSFAHALPSAYGSQPPEEGYIRHTGRDGQGYWLRIQSCSVTQ